MKKKQTILAAAAVLLVLAAAFWYGGDAPGLQGWSTPPASVPDASSAQPDSSQTASSAPEGDLSSPQTEADPASGTGEDSTPAPSTPQTDGSSAEDETPAPDIPVPSPQAEETAPPAAQPAPETPASGQTEPPEEQATTCSISIVCSTALDHLDWLAEGKEEILPAGGVMLSATEVEPQAGETAFSLLQRVTREQGIQMEASFTPGTGAAYVEGIGNLYEFDCGQRSGWLYFVNGISPGYSSSEYVLKPGDRVEWLYTCDMGQDVGASAVGG